MGFFSRRGPQFSIYNSPANDGFISMSITDGLRDSLYSGRTNYALNPVYDAKRFDTTKKPSATAQKVIEGYKAWHGDHIPIATFIERFKWECDQVFDDKCTLTVAPNLPDWIGMPSEPYRYDGYNSLPEHDRDEVDFRFPKGISVYRMPDGANPDERLVTALFGRSRRHGYAFCLSDNTSRHTLQPDLSSETDVAARAGATTISAVLAWKRLFGDHAEDRGAAGANNDDQRPLLASVEA